MDLDVFLAANELLDEEVGDFLSMVSGKLNDFFLLVHGAVAVELPLEEFEDFEVVELERESFNNGDLLSLAQGLGDVFLGYESSACFRVR